MKKLFALALLMGAMTAQAQPSQEFNGGLFVDLMRASVEGRNLIDWKVGDSMDYTVKMGPFGSGTMKKFVKSEEGDAIWLRQEIKVAGQNQTVEMLMRRADGKILKVIQNGQEAQVPDTQLEVVSTNYESVTVPLGTFNALHVIANSEDVKGLEVWQNPDQTCMEGSLKQIVPTSFVTLTMELTAFHKQN